MKTKLEKMQKIYEAGFEPDKSYNSNTGLWLRFKGVIKTNFGWEAWFSESKLWQMLPKKIQLRTIEREAYKAIDPRLGLTYLVLGYNQRDWHWEEVPRLDPERGLHDALLDLVLWYIERGHLKGEK